MVKARSFVVSAILLMAGLQPFVAEAATSQRVIPSSGLVTSGARVAFEQEIARLHALLHKGYLKKDPRITSIRGVGFKPFAMEYDAPVILEEIEELQALNLNTVRIDWNAAGNLDNYLAQMDAHNIKTIVITPVPKDIGDRSHHYDPFDNYTVQDWKDILTPFLQKYGNNSRILALDLINEPLIKDEHRSQMIELGQWVQTKCSQYVTVGLDLLDHVKPLHPAMSMITYHAYGMSLLRQGVDIETIIETHTPILREWKTLGKPIVMSETGFCTWYRGDYNDSSRGHTPYIINNRYLREGSTPETEALQYDYLANILHLVKEEDIEGYLVYQWNDDLGGKGGGWGLKTKYPELRPKTALELLA